jgi:Lon protease-like protein
VKALPGQIPLFPLPNVVLFPRVSVPLHIFEPRYRRLLQDALASDRVIGMVLLRPGWEQHYYGRPAVYSIGCAGEVEQTQTLPDGRSNVLLRGLTRFRILGELESEPYRIGTVAALEDQPGEPRNLESSRRLLLAALARAVDGPTRLVLQDDLPHDVFVNALCQSLQLQPVERQSLLDCDSVPGRYERLLEILEFRRLESSSSGGGVGPVH